MGFTITDNVQSQSDIDGFYSMETMVKVANMRGYTILPLAPNIVDILGGSPVQNNLLLHELHCWYKYPIRLFVHEVEAQHYTAIHVYEHAIWYFDSLRQKKPVGLTAEALFHVLQTHRYTVFHFSEELESHDVTRYNHVFHFLCYKNRGKIPA